METVTLAVGAEFKKAVGKFKEGVDAGVIIGGTGDIFGKRGEADEVGGAFLEVMELVEVAGEDGDNGEIADETPDLGAVGKSGGFGMVGKIIVVGKSERVEAIVGEDEQGLAGIDGRLEPVNAF